MDKPYMDIHEHLINISPHKKNDVLIYLYKICGDEEFYSIVGWELKRMTTFIKVANVTFWR